MEEIRELFEAWYAKDHLTKKQAEALLEYQNGNYVYIQTYLAFNAFTAGYVEAKK